MKAQIKALSILMMITGLLAACATASFTRDSYRVLNASAETYDAAMKSAADLYGQGVLDDEQKARVMDLAAGYWAAYHGAVTALEAYEELDTPETKEDLARAIEQVSLRLSEFLSYIKPFTVKEDKS